jgi:23S rRNA (cytidine1920-2'-O)/16S rRNA (cytidine1409-2'-O)-methyltransferase
VRRGLARSRAEALDLVSAGRVDVRGIPTPKAASLVDAATPILVELDGPRYVSRGGHKLAAALDAFAIDPAGLRVLDAGASTGGFTDCLLQRGAAQVVAVDVGHGQLDAGLRSDARVVVHERANLRHLAPGDVGGPFPLVVADLSFISLCTVAPALAEMTQPEGDLVVLVKPQFELAPSMVGKGGVVRDDAARRSALARVESCLGDAGFRRWGTIESPVTGAKGNREYLLWSKREILL